MLLPWMTFLFEMAFAALTLKWLHVELTQRKHLFKEIDFMRISQEKVSKYS